MRQIANHLIGENLWAVELLQGRTIAKVGNRLDGDLAGDNPAGAYASSVASACVACSSGAMETVCHLSFGDYSGSDYGYAVVYGHTHSRLGHRHGDRSNARLDPVLVEACMPIAEQLTAQFRSGGAFGDNLPVDADADLQTRLLALVGRKP